MQTRSFEGPKVIAEVGVNHNGDLQLAKAIATKAVEAGADVVKFQTAIPSLVQVENARVAPYLSEYGRSFDSTLEMTNSFHLPLEAFVELKDLVTRLGAEFLSTAFDLESLDFLHSIGQRTFKVPSGEITNGPYLARVATLSDSVLLSTGMSSMTEISDAIQLLVDGGLPRASILVMQCTSSYPTQAMDANLGVLATFREELGLRVGFSDHTEGVLAAVVATALGAEVIEKHVTMDRRLPGPDHVASLEVGDLAQFIQAIRSVPSLIGSGKKEPVQSELLNRPFVRRGIYASREIGEGEILQEGDLVCLRPETSISPMLVHALLGKSLKRPLGFHEALDIDDLA